MRHPSPDTMPHEMIRVLSHLEDPTMRNIWLDGICKSDIHLICFETGRTHPELTTIERRAVITQNYYRSSMIVMRQ